MMRTAVVAFITLGLFVTGCVADEGEEELTGEDLSDAWDELSNYDGSADSARCSGVVVPDRPPFNNQIALTFDDGPVYSNTELVLNVLQQHGEALGLEQSVPATFFINGAKVSSSTAPLIKRMVDEGHIVANHTQNHCELRQNGSTTSGCCRIPMDEFIRQVEATSSVMRDNGVEPYFFRFPFGATDGSQEQRCPRIDALHERGLMEVGWHIDTADWCFGSKTEGVGYCSPSTFRHVPDNYRRDYSGFTLSQAEQYGGGVLLMHDSNSFTAGSLDELLTDLENAGFEFVPLDNADRFPYLNGSDPSALPFVGSPCAGNSECAFTEGGEPGRCVSFEDAQSGQTRGFCSVRCQGFCPDRYSFAGTFCVESIDPEWDEGWGMCAQVSENSNSSCGDIVGTTPQSADRFIGTSSASARTSTVCLP